MFGKWGGKHLIENLCERWSVNNIGKIGGRNECLTSASVQMLRIDIGVQLFRGEVGFSLETEILSFPWSGSWGSRQASISLDFVRGGQ